MYHCNNCKVDIAGHRSICPLCQGALSQGEPSPEVFPAIPTVTREHNLYFKSLLFCSIAASIICLFINAMVPQSGLWSLIVVGAILCVWISVSIAVYKRSNIIKNMMWQVVTISALCVIWDALTGWHGWSVDYLLPILSVCALLTMLVVLRVLKRYIAEYLIYLFMAAILGVFPVLLWALDVVNVIYPTLICVGVSMITFAAIAVFHFERLKAELKRRFHF